MMRRHYFLKSVAALFVGAFALVGCSEEPAKDECEGEGFTRCLDTYPPHSIVEDTTSPGDEVQKLVWNAREYGPRCIKEIEKQFTSFIRAGASNTKDITIYLPGDGAWLLQGTDYSLNRGNAKRAYADREITPFSESPSPLDFVRDSTFMYVSACDSSLYLADIDYTPSMLEALGEELNFPGIKTEPRYYRGFINTTASINELARQNPDPERVFLIGSLAGGYGVIGAAAHTAELFPNADVFIIQDGAPGFVMGDLDLEFMHEVIRLWGGDKIYPKDAGEYSESGHLITLINWALERYDNLHAATFVSVREISTPRILNNAHDTELVTKGVFKCFVTSTLETIRKNAEEKAGGRYNYYVVDAPGDHLQELKGKGSADSKEKYALQLPDGSTGPTVKEWLTQFVDKSPDWRSYSEVEMTPELMGHCKDAP